MTGEEHWKQQALHHCNRADRLERENDELRAELAALELWHGRSHNALMEISRRAKELIKESPPL